MAMTLESPAFFPEDFIPETYTCDGENIHPELIISGVPDGTKSLAIIVSDPDAPSKNWIHWVVWNIPPDTGIIYENQVPQTAIEGTTDFGRPGYGGPCPPQGTHRYFFNLYALDKVVDLPETATTKDLEAAMSGHVLDTAELMGLYGKTQQK